MAVLFLFYVLSHRVPAGCRNKFKSEKSGGVYVTFFTSQPGKCRSVKQNVPVAHFVA